MVEAHTEETKSECDRLKSASQIYGEKKVNLQIYSSSELPNNKPHQSPKQSHTEDHTEQIEATSGESH